MREKGYYKWEQDVKLRLAGSPDDVITSDDRYGKDCKRGVFFSFDKNEKNQPEKDYSFINLLATIRSNRRRIYHTAELYMLYYTENEASSSSRTVRH